MSLSPLMLLTLAPTVIIMLIVIKGMNYKSVPFGKIMKVFLISALSCIPAALAELAATFFAGVLLNNSSPLAADFVEYFLIVAIIEESCKFITFRAIIMHDRSFDNTYDGVIYGAAAALGFATLENFLYVYIVSSGSYSTALIRGFMSVPLHAATGILMGSYLGIDKYKKYNNLKDGKHPEIAAFAASIALHGAYDFTLTLPSAADFPTSASFGIAAIIIIGVYIMIGIVIKRSKRGMHNIYNRYYYERLGGNFQDLFGKTNERGFSGNVVVQPYAAYNAYSGYPQPFDQSGAYRQPQYNQYNAQHGAYTAMNQNYPSGMRNAPYSPYNTERNSDSGYVSAAAQFTRNNYPQNGFTPYTAPESFVFCPRCRKQLKSSDRFCDNCGQRIK